MNETQLLGHAPAGTVLSSGPQREARNPEDLHPPLDQLSAGFGGQTTTCMIGANPVAELGRTLLEVEADHAKNHLRLSFDDSEAEVTLEPLVRGFRSHGLASLQRRILGPRHPWQKLRA